VAKTKADEWFEIYLLDHGYTPGAHEPDLKDRGIRSRPDFLPTNTSGERIVCEVKAFGPNTLTQRLRLGGFFTTSGKELWIPVLNQVRDAARTLKLVQPLGLPLVVVITNTHPEVFVDLSVDSVAHTLLGRGGKLTRDHRYISAIALLRREDHAHVEQRRSRPGCGRRPPAGTSSLTWSRSPATARARADPPFTRRSTTQ
jgi:hypothetical protein